MGGGEGQSMRFLALLLLLTVPAWAKYMAPDLADIPVDRLLATAEAKARKSPQDAICQFNLGRIHALAYATQAATLEAERGSGALPRPPEGLWPPKDIKSPVTAKAREHLKKAIVAYAAAVKLDPNLYAARLSYAWALEQAGEKAKAIAEYRALLEVVWPKEKNHEVSGFGRSLSREAAGYLIALLNKQKDAAEIARLEQIRSEAAKIPRAVTPILIPLEEAPFADLVDPASPVRFDLDGSGRRQRWGWLTPKAAWLVFLDKKNRVDSALQLFGSVTFLSFWGNGYEALAALDDDGNGRLEGPELKGLKLWNDVNCDGECQENELLTLDEAGITGLETANTRRPGYFESRVRYRDGRTGPSYDWVRP